jgi:hypothetical protein
METANRQQQPGKLKAVPHLKKPSTSDRKRSISAANVFKQRAPFKSEQAASRTAAVAARGDNHSAAARKGYKQVGLDTERPLKSTSEQSESAKHPLAVAFNGKLTDHASRLHYCLFRTLEATTEYRTSLYATAVTQINETHSNLTGALHNSDTVPIPNHQGFTRAEYLHGLVDSLYLPIGMTGLIISKSHTSGEKERVEMELGQRLSQFEAQIDADEKAVSMLQTQWERVLGEIWRCGVQVLGKEGMGAFLLGNGQGEEEPSLFVPEKGDVEQRKSKKRVTFKDPKGDELPEFIRHVRKGEDVPALPDVPMQEVQEMEQSIENMGVAPIEELKRLNEEQDMWYKKKTQQLFEDD